MGGFFDRRRIVQLGLVVAACALLAFLGSCTGGGERIELYRTSAVIDEVGEAEIHETIDYDFGHNERHGIFRTVRGLDPNADISVSSPTAPDDYVVEEGTIRVGSESTTIEGPHRYEIRFPLDLIEVVAGQRRPDRLEWRAVGRDWDVEAERVEAHLVTPVRLTAVSCYPDSCRIDKSDPGRIVATIDGLGPNEAMIISAELTEAAVPISSAAQTSLPPPPSGEPAGIPANVVTGLAGLFCVGGLLLALALILIAGRDEFRAPDIDGGGQRRLFPWQLSRQITLAEAPPDELRAWQGGILVAEDVTDDHPAAWLLELAADGDAQIYGPHLRPTIRYTVDDSTENLESIFRSSGAIHLGNYNTSASVGWTTLWRRLEGWLDDSKLWTEASRRWERRVEMPSMVTTAVAGIATIVAAAIAVRVGGIAVIPLALSSAVLGACGGLFLCRRALLVRTPPGTKLWLQVEGFRRYLCQEVEQPRARAVAPRVAAVASSAAAPSEADPLVAAVTAEAAATVAAPGR